MNPQQTSSHIIQHWDELSRDSVLNREQLVRQMIQDCVDEAVAKGISDTIDEAMKQLSDEFDKGFNKSNDMFKFKKVKIIGL